MRQLRRENDLAVLRVRLVRNTGDEPRVEFEAQVGEAEAIPLAGCAATELGMRRGDANLIGLDPIRALPPQVATAISDRATELTSRPAVWLELAEPSGALPLLPWEAMLVPALNRPVLRLPYFTLRPRAAFHSLEVVLCASSPVAKTGFDAGQMLVDLAFRIAESVPRDLSLHVFPDKITYGYVRQQTQGVPAHVVVYDPDAAEQYELPKQARQLNDTFEVVNPWLLWIRDALGSRGVDVVHFGCHGYLSGDRGALCMASSPLVNTDSAYSRFIGLGQLSSFMTQVGAWSFAVSGPPRNYSRAALRELGDSVARTGPSYVLVHDTELDPGPPHAELASAYRFLYQSAETPVPPLARSLSCWAHPRLVEFYEAQEDTTSEAADELLASDGHSLVFDTDTEQAIAAPSTPAWLAANVRVIERVQAKWLNQSEGQERISAVSPDDAAAALRNVTELLGKHVRRERDEGTLS